jgi:1-deoxy-D-xylulose-5-phosphate synthase
MLDMVKKDEKIVAITAAMQDGTGLDRIATLFPERFFDVGISEEHAVGLAAGLAKGGFKPVVAVYSTFLQRSYDQMIHDVCLQNLPVVFCLDRAGLVGEDGPTHHGIFDIAYLRHMPNMTVMAPRDTDELIKMLDLAFTLNSPVAIRYPKGSGDMIPSPNGHIELGKGQVLRDGKDIAIISIGSMAQTALETADLLKKKMIDAKVIDARFVKPLDTALLRETFKDIKKIITLEEGTGSGGFGSAILEFIETEKMTGMKVKRICLPDKFIEHGKRSELFSKYNLTPESIYNVIVNEVING